jgi:hypothetical protein
LWCPEVGPQEEPHCSCVHQRRPASAMKKAMTVGHPCFPHEAAASLAAPSLVTPRFEPLAAKKQFE